MCLALLVFPLGCAVDPPPAAEAPVPYLFEEEDPPVASVDVSDLEAAIASAVALTLSLNAGPVFPAYHAAMADTDGSCPDYYDYEGSQYWYDECSTPSGTSFSGYGFYQIYDDYDAGDGSIYNGHSLYGVARIETPDGETFVAGGSAYQLVATAVDYTYYVSQIAGSFAWDGQEASDTWLATELSPDLTMTAYVAGAYGSMVVADGGVSGLGAELATGGLDTVVFDALTLMTDALTTCPTEPGGVVSVRDADGNWYDVVFDGPAEYGDTVNSTLCDGCGSAYFRGVYVGNVCADFSALVDWEVSPW